MRHSAYVSAIAATVIGLIAAGCGSSSDSGTATDTETVTISPTTTSAADAGTDLRSLIPTPADTQQTDGPDTVPDNGVHMHFQVSGAPGATMESYKTDLENSGWSVTVRDEGGGGGGGGATYTGSNSDAYGVFTGGGYGNTTDIDACVWPTKPSKTECGD
ncbi:MAG: hypothetical protein ACPGVY_00795 [Mycobacterium sp.]